MPMRFRIQNIRFKVGEVAKPYNFVDAVYVVISIARGRAHLPHFESYPTALRTPPLPGRPTLQHK